MRSYKDYIKFVVPSLFGIFIFLTPITSGKEVTIVMGVIADFIQAQVSDYLPSFVTGIVVLSAILTLLTTLIRSSVVSQEGTIGKLISIFYVRWFWILLRVAGAVFTLMIFF